MEAAGAAARVLLSALPKSDLDLGIAEKADGSLVSDADLASQREIQRILEPCGSPILSEEAAAPDFEARQHWDRFWLVDPLDGTESFLKSRSGFAVNIALCDASGPIFGVVADPLANRMYLGGIGVPVQVAPLDASRVKQIHPRAFNVHIDWSLLGWKRPNSKTSFHLTSTPKTSWRGQSVGP